MLAIMHALTKWWQYLLGTTFMIRMDHNNLQHLLQQKTLTIEQQKWIEKISTFKYGNITQKGEGQHSGRCSINWKDEEV